MSTANTRLVTSSDRFPTIHACDRRDETVRRRQHEWAGRQRSSCFTETLRALWVVGRVESLTSCARVYPTRESHTSLSEFDILRGARHTAAFAASAIDCATSWMPLLRLASVASAATTAASAAPTQSSWSHSNADAAAAAAAAARIANAINERCMPSAS